MRTPRAPHICDAIGNETIDPNFWATRHVFGEKISYSRLARETRLERKAGFESNASQFILMGNNNFLKTRGAFLLKLHESVFAKIIETRAFFFFLVFD